MEWIGKRAVVNHHRDVPTRLLNCNSGFSFGDPEAGNLLVEGDNLEALKALLPYYAGKVKCVYIDPPYNTGNEGGVYNDNVNSPEIRNWLGKVTGKEAEDLSRHDKWLCMMYPRLRLLREFLRRDGIVLLSCDDNECVHARILLDEIFGGRNFIAQLVWEQGRKNDAKLFSIGHEYILIYATHLPSLADIKWRASKEGVVEIAAEYRRLKELCEDDFDTVSAEMMKFYKALRKGHPSKKYARAWHADKRGVWRDNNISWHGGGGPRYDLIHPVTGMPCKVPDDGWRFIESTMLQKIHDGYVEFRTDHTMPPIYKSYVYRADKLDSTNDEENGTQQEVLGSVFYRHTQPSNDMMRALFGSKVFPNPKDHEILGRLIRYVTSDDRGAIILDSFAGSGSTAHAVLNLNQSDLGNRRFILVEMLPTVAREVTSWRIRRVMEGSDGGAMPGTGGGFRYCTLGKPIFDEWGAVNDEVSFSDLAAFVFFSDTGSPIAVRATGDTPLLGTFEGRAIYLLFSIENAGVPHETAGNVLTPDLLAALPSPGTSYFDGPRTVYAEGCTVPVDRLAAANVTFKQIPYQLQAA